MLRTGEQYREWIRDGRQVWINGERVKDVTTHPSFKPIVASWLLLESGAPALNGALVAFDCTLAQEVRWGSHHVLIGHVRNVVRGGGRPLVYCDRGYGRVALEPSLPA